MNHTAAHLAPQSKRASFGTSRSAKMRARRRAGIKVVLVEAPVAELIAKGLLAPDRRDDAQAIATAAQAAIARGLAAEVP